MIRTVMLACIVLGLAQNINAQNKLPLIKANSKMVDIRDGKTLTKGNWTIVPEAKPDVYITSERKVTFITDVDSISFTIDPAKAVYDFVILLNEKDSAYTQIKYVMPRIEMLRKAKKYNLSDNRTIPKFTYQNTNDPNLLRIRKELRLDSIAGTGTETSRILNLLHWVHKTIRHDGSSNNPEVKNAIDIIKVCKSENRGVNCRMLATVLNECYLSMGIRSRYVTCMPKETEFDDCHVINMVYSNDLKKWLWIDPTFDAFVMDEKGGLLGIEEVRERLISNRPLVLNPDANWNGTTPQTKAYYLETYMAKNLYRMQCPMVSGYDTETWKKGKEITYIELLPLDGIEQDPQKSEQSNTETGVKFHYYKTNNPALFWTIPD